MGTPVERQNLSYWFFILAALLALSTVWAVYDEFFPRRPWKLYQDKFFELERKKAEADLAFAKKGVEARKDDLAKLKAQLGAAQQKLAGTEYAQWQKKQDALALDLADAKQGVAFRKSDLDAAYYQFRQAKEGKDAAGVKKWSDRLSQLSDAIAKNQGRQDKIAADYDAVTAQIDQVRSDVSTLEKKISDIEDPVASAERKLAAANGESSHLEQYWIPRLDKVDRCQVCHVAVDKCGYSQPWEVLALKAHEGEPGGPADDAAVAKKFCVNDDDVAAYATVSAAFCEGDSVTADAATECRDAKTLGEWENTSRLYCGPHSAVAKWVVKDGKACSTKDAVAALEQAQKAKGYDVPFVFQSHPLRDEILGNVHPAGRFGCTACHGGEGVQTKGVGHKAFDHAEDDPYWEEWQDPLLAKVRVWGKKTDLTAASCNKCHRDDNDLAHADWLNQGKQTVTQVGCFGCHPIPGYEQMRKPGPRLTEIKAKVTPGWLVSWISYPKSFKPRTSMPNFWPEAIDDSHLLPGHTAGTPRLGTKEYDLRQKEVTAIAAYLWSESDAPKNPTSVPGDAARGKALFDSVGCRGCHTTEKDDVRRPAEGDADRDFAPNLSNVGSKTTAEWIFRWVKDPKAYWPETKMPNLRLSDEEAGSIAKYLVTLKGDPASYPTPAEFQPDFPKDRFAALAARGKGLIGKYGCFGCHDIKGFEQAQKIGADLSEFGSKSVELLDFGDAITNHLKQTWYNWVDTKLRHPRIFRYERVDTRMPQFDFSDSEVRAIMTFLKGQEDNSKIPHDYLASQDDRGKAVVAGEKMIEFYGCRNCHIIDGRGGRIRDRYDDDHITLAPPIVNHEGFKTQPSWLFGFIKNPGSVKIRPWLDVRMPTFGFTDEQATDLVRYFSAKENKPWPYVYVSPEPVPPARLAESKKMFDELKCLSCHTTGTPPPGVSTADLAPNLLLAHDRLRPEWIPVWLTDPQKQMEGTRMPGFFPDGNTPLPQYFGGDAKAQMEALRDLIFHFDEVIGQAQAKAGPARAGKAKKRAGRTAPAVH